MTTNQNTRYDWEYLLNDKFKNFKHSINDNGHEYVITINKFIIRFVKDESNFVIKLNDWIETKITKSFIHECRLISWLLVFSEIFNDKKIRFYDIGALFGFHSFLFSKFNTKSNIFSIEGNPITANYIQKNININQISNITVINKVVDNKNEKKKFLINGFSFQDTKKNYFLYLIKCFIKKIFLQNKNKKKMIKKINTITLEDLMFPLDDNELEILKIDTEGFQARFLPYFSKFLIKRNAILLLELDEPELMKIYNSTNQDLIKPFLQNGYTAFWVNHRDKESKIQKISSISMEHDCDSLITLIPKKLL